MQEALANVTRHAGATRAAVTLAYGERHLRVTVTDDGAGFDPAAVPAPSLGLRGMRERAGLVGGHLNIASAPGAGTTVRLEAPL